MWFGSTLSRTLRQIPELNEAALSGGFMIIFDTAIMVSIIDEIFRLLRSSNFAGR
jgi:hypothetical protein